MMKALNSRIILKLICDHSRGLKESQHDWEDEKEESYDCQDDENQE
jgi:hypothetical protein